METSSIRSLLLYVRNDSLSSPIDHARASPLFRVYFNLALQLERLFILETLVSLEIKDHAQAILLEEKKNASLMPILRFLHILFYKL